MPPKNIYRKVQKVQRGRGLPAQPAQPAQPALASTSQPDTEAIPYPTNDGRVAASVATHCHCHTFTRGPPSPPPFFPIPIPTLLRNCLLRPLHHAMLLQSRQPLSTTFQHTQFFLFTTVVHINYCSGRPHTFLYRILYVPHISQITYHHHSQQPFCRGVNARQTTNMTARLSHSLLFVFLRIPLSICIRLLPD